MESKFNPSSVISAKLGKIKPEMPESVKVMMTEKMEEPSSKSIKLSVKKSKKKKS